MRNFLSVFLLIIVIVLIPVHHADGNRFNSHAIILESPDKDNLVSNGSLILKGKTLNKNLFVCIKTPDREMVVYPVKLQEGSFDEEFPIPFGQGEYTVWMDNNERHFNGFVNFSITNNFAGNRFLSSSYYIDSNNPTIKSKSQEIIGDSVDTPISDREKVIKIHDWIARNITYDSNFNFNEPAPNFASDILKNEKGICRDYSFLFAALVRCQNIPTKVVYGNANTAEQSFYHAWNEVYIDGEWLTVDTTFDAGYTKNGKFYFNYKDRYLFPDESMIRATYFNKTVKPY